MRSLLRLLFGSRGELPEATRPPPPPPPQEDEAAASGNSPLELNQLVHVSGGIGTPPPSPAQGKASSSSSTLEQSPNNNIISSMVRSATDDEAQEQHDRHRGLSTPNSMDDQQHNINNVKTIRLRVFRVNPYCDYPQLERLGVDSLAVATEFQYCDQHIFIDIPSDLIQSSFFQYPKPPISVKLGKTFLGLTYQAVVAFLVFHFQGTPIIFGSHTTSTELKLPALLFCIAEVAVVIGFTACLIGILLREAYAAASVMIEQAGSLAAAFGFFMMMGMFLTSISQWIGWLCGGASLVAFFLAFKKIKTS